MFRLICKAHVLLQRRYDSLSKFDTATQLMVYVNIVLMVVLYMGTISLVGVEGLNRAIDEAQVDLWVFFFVVALITALPLF